MDPKKILIVEDEKDICDLYAVNLSSAHFQVVKAYTGEEGFQKFNENELDMILLDILLPDINGIEILKKIKAINKEVKVIMLTNLTADKTIDSAYKEGADGYLLKATLTRASLIEEIKYFFEE